MRALSLSVVTLVAAALPIAALGMSELVVETDLGLALSDAPSDSVES